MWKVGLTDLPDPPQSFPHVPLILLMLGMWAGSAAVVGKSLGADHFGG